jgi:hypothetical protein
LKWTNWTSSDSIWNGYISGVNLQMLTSRLWSTLKETKGLCQRRIRVGSLDQYEMWGPIESEILSFARNRQPNSTLFWGG